MSETPAKPGPEGRAAYRAFRTISTRWMDNDAYGHVNNVVYYSFFDTAVNRWLVEPGVLDIASSPAIGLVVETACRYARPITFPDRVTAGIRVAHLAERRRRGHLLRRPVGRGREPRGPEERDVLQARPSAQELHRDGD